MVRIVTDLKAGPEPPARDRVLRAFKLHSKEYVAKIEAGLRREFDKMVALIIDELQPVADGRVEASGMLHIFATMSLLYVYIHDSDLFVNRMI
jgi:hypothetical protein